MISNRKLYDVPKKNSKTRCKFSIGVKVSFPRYPGHEGIIMQRSVDHGGKGSVRYWGKYTKPIFVKGDGWGEYQENMERVK